MRTFNRVHAVNATPSPRPRSSADGRWVEAALLGLAVLFSAAVFPRLPARFAVHWGPGGGGDLDAPRLLGALAMPVVMLAVWAMAPRADPALALPPLHVLLTDAVLACLLVGHAGILGTALGWRPGILAWVCAAALAVGAAIAVRLVIARRR